MMAGRLLVASVLGLLAACQPEIPFAGQGSAADEAIRAAGAVAEEIVSAPATAVSPPPTAPTPPHVDLEALARRPQGDESMCRTFARTIAEAALRHETDAQAFMAELTDEFVDGTDDPFELKDGLRERRWNQRYFYAGHGGFRPEYDDAQRYPRGGNHQPGHFISVLAIAARFGEEPARVAIAQAGDYEPGDEDDLRLSNVAIPLGAGLRDGTVSPAEVAHRARELCR